MILSNNSNPKNCLYYIGGIILKIIKNQEDYKYDYLELYNELKNNHNVSFQLYNFTLDWLYLISAVKFDEEDGVVKCI